MHVNVGIHVNLFLLLLLCKNSYNLPHKEKQIKTPVNKPGQCFWMHVLKAGFHASEWTSIRNKSEIVELFIAGVVTYGIHCHKI